MLEIIGSILASIVVLFGISLVLYLVFWQKRDVSKVEIGAGPAKVVIHVREKIDQHGRKTIEYGIDIPGIGQIVVGDDDLIDEYAELPDAISRFGPRIWSFLEYQNAEGIARAGDPQGSIHVWADQRD